MPEPLLPPLVLARRTGEEPLHKDGELRLRIPLKVTDDSG